MKNPFTIKQFMLSRHSTIASAGVGIIVGMMSRIFYTGLANQHKEEASK